MAVVSLTGQDTIIINSRILSDLADADSGSITFPNELASVKTGKNGNAIFAFNESGRQCDLSLRIVKGSPDDKFFNNFLSIQSSNFSGTLLLEGELIKRVGDGKGNITNDTYILTNGIISKNVDTKTNSDGDIEQSVSIYSLKFATAPRVID